jgi:hypothetical protein
MSARFARLSIMDGTILASMLAILALFTITNKADASENKTRSIFEIKISQTVKIPEFPSVQLIADLMNNSDNVETSTGASTLSVVPNPTPVPTEAITQVQRKASTQIANYIPNDGVVPPKAVGDARVYMHEPEIRAYVCPKLGDKCNTFIAILAAENGTHECTRDNRGTNRNGSIDIGLTQINWTPASPYSFAQLQDCKFNLDIAMKKYDARGFQPWAAYTSGRYLKHLPAILASAASLEAQAAKTPEPEPLTVN